ncbi:hypothetical protein HYH03_001521 [Edaphochlamys debaryana]|uniref:Cation efflux protein transmembrane domain-containing protein n=1 Tax=Edaphochlamys debaryana TaxID=47281 RepID=A0A835YFF3_9CHLO|nr:hypothetical protein HYH03_001521 [Edaphochlamys debaryana]|eukprot:KAG2500759.1 hypothetical protein HYH03_001521 [Edaphochlamys debaryana]
MQSVPVSVGHIASFHNRAPTLPAARSQPVAPNAWPIRLCSLRAPRLSAPGRHALLCPPLAAAASAAAPFPGDDRSVASSSGSSAPYPGGSGSGGKEGPLGAGLGPAERTRAQRHQDELHTLNVAIVVNVVIFGAKLWAHGVSGSSSMLAEAMHSVADVLNQMLLRIGLLKAQQGPTEMHPYGYARDRFVWSLISAVGIFFLGAGASFIHGIHTLLEHRALEHAAVSYVVLAVSGLLEGYSLWVATRAVVAGARSKRMGVLPYIKSGMDPTTVAVMLEDGGAVLGLMIAGVCTALAHSTGNAMWDAAGSILVGILLGGIATFLVSKNRQLLIGRAMAPADVAAVQALIRSDPVVLSLTETKTEEIGPGIFRFKAEVAWDGEQVVRRYLQRCGREQLMGRLEAAASRGDRDALEAVLRGYGRDLVSAVGAEVDRIESEIQKMNPGICWVDLETDRGRQDPWRRGAAILGIEGAPLPPGAGSSGAAGSETGTGGGGGGGGAAASGSGAGHGARLGGNMEDTGGYVCTVDFGPPVPVRAQSSPHASVSSRGVEAAAGPTEAAGPGRPPAAAASAAAAGDRVLENGAGGSGIGGGGLERELSGEPWAPGQGGAGAAALAEAAARQQAAATAAAQRRP